MLALLPDEIIFVICLCMVNGYSNCMVNGYSNDAPARLVCRRFARAVVSLKLKPSAKCQVVQVVQTLERWVNPLHNNTNPANLLNLSLASCAVELLPQGSL